MMNEIIKLLAVTLVSAFIAGQLFRMAYRFKYCQPIMDYTQNCCINCTRRFRLIEFVPIMGTILTMIKCSGQRNRAHIALYIELNCFLIIPILYIFIFSLALQLFLFVSITAILIGLTLTEGDSTQLA